MAPRCLTVRVAGRDLGDALPAASTAVQEAVSLWLSGCLLPAPSALLLLRACLLCSCPAAAAPQAEAPVFD